MTNNPNNLYEFDEYVLNADQGTLWRGKELVQMPAKVFETLKLLVERHGEVLSKEEMLEIIWEGAFVEENNLSQKISILRKLFGNEKEFIETLPKIGFRFVEPVRINLKGFKASLNDNSGLEFLPDNISMPFDETFAPPIDSHPTDPATPSRFYYTALGLMLSALVGIGAYYLAGSFKDSQDKKPSASFDYAEITDTGDIDSSAISHDGKFIAFTKTKRGSRIEKTSLRLMDIESKNDVEIVIDGNIQPSFLRFAPDGKSIYFRTRGKRNQYEKIYQISTFGGEPKLIAENIWGIFSLSPDGKELTYVQREISGDRRKIVIQNIENGKKDVVLDSSEQPGLKPHHVPAFSPDQRLLAFSPLEKTDAKATIVVIDLRTRRTELIQTPFHAIDSVIWTPSGDGFYLNALELGKRFQLWNLSYPGGKLARVTSDSSSYRDLSISKNGTLAVNRVDIYSNVWRVPGAKRENAEQLTRGDAELGGLLTAQFVPNGDILYNARFNKGSNIRMMNAKGENGRVFVEKQLHTEHNFSFSKSRSFIFFEFEDRIWKAKFDGSDVEEMKLGAAVKISLPAVSYDDNWLFFVKREKDQDAIWKIPIDGGSAQLVLGSTQLSSEAFLSTSPDGKYLAFDYEKQEKIGDKGANSGNFRNYGFLNLATNQFRVIEVPAYRSILRWTNGGKSFDYPSFTEKGSAILRRDVENDDKPTKIFELENELIFRFDWSSDGNDLLIGRGNYKMNVVTLRLRSTD